MAPLQIRDDFIKTGTKARPGDRHDKKWIVIHETGNTKPGSDAQSHAAYIKDLALQNELYLSWHYTVDDHAVYHHIPDDEVAWHAGDGRKDDGGNLSGIGVEICVNPECDYEKALRNAAQLTAQLMRAHGIPIENVRQHHDFSGRDCPERLRREGRWEDFLAMCRSGKAAAAEKHPQPAQRRAFAAGDAVRLYGTLYADSQGTVPVERGIQGRACTVTMCADKRRAAPYRIDERGWAKAADLTRPCAKVRKSPAKGRMGPGEKRLPLHLLARRQSCQSHRRHLSGAILPARPGSGRAAGPQPRLGARGGHHRGGTPCGV